MAEDSPAAQTRDTKPLLRIDNVSKRFGGVRAVDGVSLDIASGEFFALLGPSGCGKTTLLRMLAGFETPDDGRILLDGNDIANVMPHKRPVNMMFQNYALFPHLTVQGNIAFGLKRSDMARDAIATRIAEMVALVRLEGLETRRPDQLSGGQKQRVALARALARRPRVLLLDEPLAALDKKLREQTQAELVALQRRLRTTFVIVTHDQDEAMTMADRIGVMNHGRLAQVASPRELYEAPASRFVAEFVGDVNMLEGEVSGRGDGRLTIATKEAGEIMVTDARAVAGGALCVAVRPEKIRIACADASEFGEEARNRLDGVIADVSYLGDATLYQVRLGSGATLRARVANASRHDAAFAEGDCVVASFAPDDAVVLEG